MRTHGFTLLEVIVVVGVIALLSGITAQVFLTSTRNATKSDVVRTVKQNGELSLEIMTRMIQNARTIASSCIGTSTTTLTIENFDEGRSTFGCSMDGEVARIASESASGTAYLTARNVTTLVSGGATCDDSTLAFVCREQAGFPSQVTISFSLSQTGSPAKAYEQVTVPFETTVAVRSYQSQ